uniref:Aminotransferase class I/classII large domain-containing protein n=1 Tax=Timema genevievae TaxID=629358 RepID=A0A7R9JVT0_TIMGE|nr:unnamed protein product [Timema genevievae]
MMASNIASKIDARHRDIKDTKSSLSQDSEPPRQQLSRAICQSHACQFGHPVSGKLTCELVSLAEPLPVTIFKKFVRYERKQSVVAAEDYCTLISSNIYTLSFCHAVLQIFQRCLFLRNLDAPSGDEQKLSTAGQANPLAHRSDTHSSKSLHVNDERRQVQSSREICRLREKCLLPISVVTYFKASVSQYTGMRITRRLREQTRCYTGLWCYHSDNYSIPPSCYRVEYIQLALEHSPLNLGQGFPDFAAPEYVTKGLAEVTTGDNVLLNQYTRGFGHPRLVNALSRLYSKLIGRQIDPLSEVIVTSGAYQALFNTIMGHTSPGDEVIIIEPFFDCYYPMVKAAGGVPRLIPLRPKKTSGSISSGDWVLDKDELTGLFNAKTKAIILNTPHNPLGKVFTRQELEVIADLCKKWNVLCIADEVYEWLVYKPYKHIRIATLPDMWDRTVTIGSAGKTFSVTGWKIGWAYGPAHLLKNLQTVHQNCVYTCSTPLQEAVARGFELEFQRLGKPECYFESLPQELLSKRDFMAKFLSEVGMVPTIPEGGYFMIADWTSLAGRVRLEEETDKNKDYRFTKWMTKNVKLQGIPPSAFYGSEHANLGENYVRYCFIKKDENLQKAAEILQKWKASSS